MASPQIENGYTRIANELMEALCKTRVPGEARQVFDVILRKTYGYGKRFDKIALSQLQEATNLNRGNVCRATRTLIAMNMIVRTTDGTHLSTYSVNKNFDTWGIESKSTLPKTRVESDARASVKYAHKLASEVTPTIEINKNTKEIPAGAGGIPPDIVVEIIQAFVVVDPKNKTYYGNTTQRAACAFLAKEYGLEEVLKRISVLPKTNKIPYFPSITTPLQLRDKWVALQDAVDRKRGEIKNKSPIAFA